MTRIAKGILLFALLIALPASAGLIADWGERYGDEGTGAYNFQRISAVDFDGAGNIYVAGEFRGQINLGGSTFFSNTVNKYDIFLAKYSPAGVHIWSVAGGGSDNDRVHDIDVASTGGVAVAGETSSPIFTMGGASDTTNGQSDAFAVQYSSGGVFGWSRVWGGTSMDVAHSIAWRTGTNSIVVSGTYRATVDFGVGPAHTAAGFADFFLAEVKVWGVMSAADVFGGTGDEKWTSVCIDQNNDVIFAGTFENKIDFGNGALTALGDQDACLVKIPSIGGAATWSQNFGGTAAGDACWSTSVATDGSNLYLTGFLLGSADLGSGTMTSAGGSDVWVAAYKSGGIPTWSVLGGSIQSDFGNQIDYYNGRLSVAGLVQGNANFGPLQVTSAGDYDALLLVYDVSGNIEYAKSGGGSSYDEATQAAFDSNGICMVGTFRGTADFGGIQLINPVNTVGDGFMVRYVENSSVGVTGAIVPVLHGLTLGAAQPNPFRDITVLEYASEGDGGIRSADVFDVAGRLVRTLNRDGVAQVGRIRWDGRNDRGVSVSAGVYFIRVSDGLSATGRRVTVVR